MHHDWGTGTVVFGLGLLLTGISVRQLRRAGYIR
jgi:hypothetical protein